MPVGSHAPGYGRARVVGHGLGSATGGVGASSAAWGGAGSRAGSLEEMGAAFTEPSLTVSSLGSWADECERADAALAAAKAQMGRGCPDESPGDATATAKAQLDEEDWEWLTALGAAMALPQPRPAGTGGQPLGRQEAPRSTQGPRSTGRGW